MSALQEDWRILVELFPANWKELATRAGAVQRLRGFNSVNELLRTLLLHVGCGWSLRETAVHAKLAGLADVSDVTLLNRLRQAEDWLRLLCQGLWQENGIDLQPAVRGYSVRLLDATVVREPGKTGGQWRIHYSLRLPTLECDYFALTGVKGEGTGERLGRFSFQRGELVMADAAYCNPPGIEAVVQQQAELCVRFNPLSLPVFNQQGKRLGLQSKLRSLKKAGEIAEWPVWVRGTDQMIAGRVCALRKSEAAILQAQRRLDDKQQRGKGAITPETREYARYVMVFTTLPANRVSARQVLASYRLRWQVELVFRRLKSIVQLGHVPKHDDRSTRAWLYGKLFVALLTQKLAYVGAAISPWGYYLPEETAHPQPLA